MPYILEWGDEKLTTESYYAYSVRKNQLIKDNIEFKLTLTGAEKNFAKVQKELAGWKKRHSYKLSQENKNSIRKFLRTCDIFEQKQKKRKGKNGRIAKKNNRVGRKTSNNKLTDSGK